MKNLPPLWTAFKLLPLIARVGLVLAPFLPLVVVWATFNANNFPETQLASLRTTYSIATIFVAGFNFALLWLLSLSVEKHPQFWRTATSTDDFWKSLE